MKFVLGRREDQNIKLISFTEEQIIEIVKELETGAPFLEFCRKFGVSIYKWKATFSCIEVSVAKPLKSPEDANAEMKRMLSDAILDKVALISWERWQG